MALEAYHVHFLQSILGICWWHRKTHTEIGDTAKVDIELLLLQRQLRLLGHVIRVTGRKRNIGTYISSITAGSLNQYYAAISTDDEYSEPVLCLLL